MKSLFSRRVFLRASAFLAAGKAFENPLFPDAKTIVISVPAKGMRDRADAFRKMFVANYLASNTPFPVFSLLAKSGLLPDSLDAERKLGACGNLLATGGVFRLSAPPQADITLPYHAFIADQSLRNEVTIPKDLTIRVQDDAASGRLQVNFQPPIQVHQIDRLTVNGIVAPIPATVLLTQIILDSKQLRYNVTDSKGSPQYAIVLDFALESGAPSIHFEGAALRKPNGFLAAFLTFALCITTGCVNNVHGSGSGQPLPPTPYPDKEVCFNQSAPPGFIRIDSKSAGLAGCPNTDPTVLNVFVYTDYVNRSSGAQLLVCADAPIPPGWTDASGAYHDDKGCDAAKYVGTQYGNERLIYKN
jgi:hypothetical protein